MADARAEYDRLLAKERDAWMRLWASKKGDQYDPLLMVEWLAASRASVAARYKALDQLLEDDPTLATRPYDPNGGPST